ncbi:hypothetical protein E3C21_06275 [Salmonella enterica subsp. enterica]|nr:hypothetical protein [Salmonella enterica subsp. enterica]EBL7901933.1 hypothetical protein [Salmonella enterica]
MPVFNLLFLIAGERNYCRFDAVTTCHFVIIDIDLPGDANIGINIALQGQRLREAICTKSPSANGHWN